MKRLATILLVLITVSCSSQTINYLPYYKFKYKLGAGRLEVDSSATIPNDTTYSAPNNSIAIKGDSLYVKTSNRWRGVASVSSGPGGVTSVGATASGALSVSGSPVTSSGTLGFVWTGAASEYVKGNGVASNFSTDVKTVGDARYAYKLHTHLFDHITNGVSAVRNLFSVGAGLSYNPATGVFSALDTLDPANYALITQLNDSMTTVRDSLTAIAARIGTGGSSTDTTSLSNRIDQKQNLSDTSTWDATRAWVLSQGYGTGTSVDTTSLSNRINQKQNISDTNTVDATRYWVQQQNYVTQSGARSAISLTTTGTSGAATYNNTTGVLNIPQYSLSNAATAVFRKANYTVTDEVTHVIMHPTASTPTVTIPAASASTGRIIRITNQSTLFNVTLSTNVLYDSTGLATSTVTPRSSVELVSDGTNWKRYISSWQTTYSNASGTGISVISGTNLTPSTGTYDVSFNRIKGDTNVSVTLSGNDLLISAIPTYTPTSSTDSTKPVGSITQDDTYLYKRKSDGTWVKIAWQTF